MPLPRRRRAPVKALITRHTPTRQIPHPTPSIHPIDENPTARPLAVPRQTDAQYRGTVAIARDLVFGQREVNVPFPERGLAETPRVRRADTYGEGQVRGALGDETVLVGGAAVAEAEGFAVEVAYLEDSGAGGGEGPGCEV